MGRVTVWVPDELEATARSALPDLNWSAAVQDGLRRLLECEHDELACTSCGTGLARRQVSGPALGRFFAAVMFELGLKVAQPGYEGAARIVRRVAADHDVPGLASVPVPRATRANHEDRADAAVAELPREADSRRRHPTARPVPIDHPGPQGLTQQEKTA